MLALQHYNNKSTLLLDAISVRHTRSQNTPINHLHNSTTPHTSFVSFQAAKTRTNLKPAEKYKSVLETMTEAGTSMSNMGTENFAFQLERCKAFVKSVVEGTAYYELTAADKKKILFSFFFF